MMKKRNSNSTNHALALLLIMAFIFSFATIYFSGPSIARSLAALESINIMGGFATNTTSRSSSNKKTRTSPPPPPGGPRHSVSDMITWILSESDKDDNTQHAALKRFEDSPMINLEFPPGTLTLDSAHALRHCYADPEIYANHLKDRGDGSKVRVSYSEKYNLAYVMIPKSGSSTARYTLEKEFNAKEMSLSLKPNISIDGDENMVVITFVRDPLSRFYSQYDEAYVRTAPWKKGQNEYYIDPDTKAQDKPHPFPYLYENFNSYVDYEDVYCPIKTRKSRKECKQEKTKEDGTLASRFERFVLDYNGRDPFDIHLNLQVPLLSSNDGLPLYITNIYNTTDSEGGWKSIAKQFLGENATLGSNKKNDNNGGEVIAGRSYPRRFNSDLVSDVIQRRICQLTLIDYCCLNLPLPDVCRGRHYYNSLEDDVPKRDLFCILDKQGRIQPGIFPDKSKS